MKKILALLLTLALLFSLAACGGGDDEKTPSNDDKTPSSSQQQEQSTPDPDPGEDEPEETPDEGNEDDDDGVTVADCNASLDEMGITGFRFPEDLTAVECFGYMGGSAQVKYCPVEQDRYEEILQSVFSDTGMTTTDAFGNAISTLDEAIGVASTDKRLEHNFQLTENDKTFFVAVYYYPAEYDDFGKIYEAKTLDISVNRQGLW